VCDREHFMLVCVCLTDLNDLLGVQPEVKVPEDEIRQSLEPLIRDPAHTHTHTHTHTSQT